MPIRNTPKLAAVVLLLSIGTTAYAISRNVGAVSLRRHTPSVSISRDLSERSLALEERQSIRNTSASPLSSIPRSEASEEALAEIPATAPQTIAAVAESESEFSVLAVALEAAGLTDMLSEEGPFTVFAPTDDAFYSLPAGQLETLLQPENRDQLVALLTHHVVEGKVLSSDFRAGDIPTVDDGILDVSLERNVNVDGAQVLESDIPASNGVIHAVDTVIVPNQVSSAIPPAEQPSEG